MSRRLASIPVRTASPLALAITGKAGSPKSTPVSASCSPSTAGRHERGVERAAHLERNDPLGAARLAALARPGRPPADRPRSTVWSGALRFAATATPSGPEASLQAWSTCSVDETEHGGHGAGPRLARRVHQLAAAAHERRRRGGAHGAGRDVGAVLAEAVPGRGADRAHPVLHHGPYGRGVGQDRRLGVVGEGELVSRALPT